jgi:hypothetical protein
MPTGSQHTVLRLDLLLAFLLLFFIFDIVELDRGVTETVPQNILEFPPLKSENFCISPF